MLLVFDDMVADMESKKILSPIVSELFIRRRKINVSRVPISFFLYLNQLPGKLYNP